MKHSVIIYNLLLLLSISVLFLPACTEEPKEEVVSEKNPVDSIDPILEDYESPERKVGYLNKEGEVVIEAQFDEARNFSESKAAVNMGGMWGYIDPQGQMVIPTQYLGAWTFQNGRARVQSAGNRMFGYISSEGDTVIRFEYDEARDFKGKLATVRKGAFWGVIDKQGDNVIPPQFDNVEILSAEYVTVSDKDIWGVYHVQKELIIPHVYQKVYGLRGNVLRVKNVAGKYLYVNLENEALFEESYYKAYDPQEGVYAVCESVKQCYLIDRQGDQLSQIYQSLHPANEGLFIGKSNGLWGVIKSNGDTIIPFRYDLIYNFKEGYAPYLKNNLWGYLSANGQVMTSPQFGLAWPFHNGVARVLTRMGTVLINNNFEIINETDLGEVRDFHEGLAAFRAY